MNFLVIHCLAILALGSAQVNFEICTTAKHTDACKQIARTDNFKCDIRANKVGCLLMIEKGQSSFGTFTAEEAFLATEFTDNLTVVGEFMRESSIDQAEYETVVLVKNTINVIDGALKGLKGFKYCHPGFGTMNTNSYILKEFEMQVLKDNGADNCDSDVETIAENYIKMLDGYFGPSCRPGKWVEDPDFDKMLKAKYFNLTQLCSISAYAANKNDPFLQSLECLLSGHGDVALTTRAVVNQFMVSNGTDMSAYRYICREGYTANVDNTCTWTSQPWQLLLAHRDAASNLRTNLQNWFRDYIFNPNVYSVGSDDASKKLEERQLGNLMMIISPYTNGFKLNITDSLSLYDYMQKFRQRPTLDDSKLCKRELKWCTISEEEQLKCRWFAQASLNYGIQPVINCVQRTDKFECITAIRSNEADIVTIEADLGFPAIRQNLSAIAFPETKKNMEVYSLILVKGNITGIENLKNKKGCFNQYGSMAWVSFIDAAREVVLPKDSCDYGKFMNDFVSDACMPGARDSKFGKSNHIDENKLCGACRSDISSPTVNCNADTGNAYYGNVGALLCVQESEGAFAVLTKTGELLQSVPNQVNFTVLCKNGTLAKYPGLNVDQDCYLSVATTSSIVTRRGDPMNRDVELALQEYDEKFAIEINSPFKLFGDFSGGKDLLFYDSTLGLDLPNSNAKEIQNYVGIFEQIDNDFFVPGKDGANFSSISIICLIICSSLSKLIM